MWLPTFPPLQNDTLINSFCLHILSRKISFALFANLFLLSVFDYFVPKYSSIQFRNLGIFLAFLISSPMPPTSPLTSHQDISICSPLDCIFLLQFLSLAQFLSQLPHLWQSLSSEMFWLLFQWKLGLIILV